MGEVAQPDRLEAEKGNHQAVAEEKGAPARRETSRGLHFLGERKAGRDQFVDRTQALELVACRNCKGAQPPGSAADPAPIVIGSQGAQRIAQLLNSIMDRVAAIGVLEMVEIGVQPFTIDPLCNWRLRIELASRI